jgi:hypothetical protein
MKPRIVHPLSIEEIEIAAKGFKENLQREAARYIRRHNSSAALTALEAAEYIDNFTFELKLRAGSQLGLPSRARPIRLPMIEQRDAEWTRVVLEIPNQILTPAQGAKYLARDREQRARTVNAARQRRGPAHW